MDFIEVLYAAKIEPEIFQNRHLHKRQALVKEEASVSNISARTFPLHIKHQTREGRALGIAQHPYTINFSHIELNMH